MVWSSKCQDHRRGQHRIEHKGQTPSPRVTNNIFDPAGNRTRAAAWLEGRGSTTRTTATGHMNIYEAQLFPFVMNAWITDW